jgi:hypothetical protein
MTPECLLPNIIPFQFLDLEISGAKALIAAEIEKSGMQV